MQWYLKVLRNYTNFKGRARRKEYWMFMLFYTIFSLIVTIIDSTLHLNEVLTGIYTLVFALPSLAVGARRLHDIGKSGWWQLLGIIPLIGDIILIVMMCKDSQSGPNRFGPNPKASDIAA
jgi:uncharacterized membrane protein YhaH (DUF805 family)